MGESLFSHSWDKDEILQGNRTEPHKNRSVVNFLALKIGLDFQRNLGGGNSTTPLKFNMEPEN